MTTALMPFDQQRLLADAFAKSALFGIKTPEQALALMALCEAEGLHPAIAVRDYHIIDGRPSLKSDAMLARFQAAGGIVRWIDMTDICVTGEFTHPQGGQVTITWDIARAKQAELGGRSNWKKYPRQMLRARVISEGVRTVFPGCVVGIYTPEEVQEFDSPAPSRQKEKTLEPIETTIINTETGDVKPKAIASSSVPNEKETSGLATPGAIKMVRIRLADKDLSEADACAANGIKSMEGINIDDINSILGWIKNQERAA